MAEMSPFSLVIYSDTNFDFTSDRSSMHEFIRSTAAFTIAAFTEAYSNIEYYDNIRPLRLLDRNVTLELGYI